MLVGYVKDGKTIVHIEGDWKDITNKFDEFVDDMLTSEEERPYV